MKVGAIIQARLTSSRLPGKVLLNLPFSGKEKMIDQIIFRSKAANKVDEVMLATSTESSDNLLVDHVAPTINVYRGSLENVLSRYYKCASLYHIDHIVRITGDNPCIDPVIIDQAIDFHIVNYNDYTKTEGLPVGVNIEIVSFKAIKTANKQAVKSYQKEHVTPYITDNPSIFKIGTLKIEGYESLTKLRLTVDYPSDFSLVNLLYNYLGKEFSLTEINSINLIHPWLFEINTNFQKRIFHSTKEELDVAIDQLERLEMKKASSILKNAIILK